MNDTGYTVKIEIFDPPMCCAGGLCGPAIDPALLDVNEAVLTMKNQHGIRVQRHLLQQEGQAFMNNPGVLALLQEHDTDVLPITVVDGKVVKQKTFPSYEELLEWSGVEKKQETTV
ncbi:MAG: arsenite efflux transporter metallochaperone ArsD [Alkalispirochaeta sp.]